MRAGIGAYFRATLRVVGTALLVTRLARTDQYDALAARLRESCQFPPADRDPIIYAQVVGRLLPVLPPWNMGRCLKRSLVLLHLWSGCGLNPDLHLGVCKQQDGDISGHAWLTAAELAESHYGGEPSSHSTVVTL